MKLKLSIAALLFSFSATAQHIGINTPTPLMQLDVRSSDSAALLLYNTQPFSDSEKTALYFRAGSNYTGAIKTHVQSAVSQFARMGFFTYSLSNANALLERMSIIDNGNVGINTVSPAAKLDVIGNVKITDGTQATGKLLTSDAAGLASWQDAVPKNTGFKVSGGALLLNNQLTLIPFTTSAISGGTLNYDDGGNWSNATNKFTAPAAGLYHFDVKVNPDPGFVAAGGYLQLRMVVDATITEAFTDTQYNAGDALRKSVDMSWNVKLNAGGTVQFFVFNTLGVTVNSQINKASGYRVY